MILYLNLWIIKLVIYFIIKSKGKNSTRKIFVLFHFTIRIKFRFHWKSLNTVWIFSFIIFLPFLLFLILKNHYIINDLWTSCKSQYEWYIYIYFFLNMFHFPNFHCKFSKYTHCSLLRAHPISTYTHLHMCMFLEQVCNLSFANISINWT